VSESDDKRDIATRRATKRDAALAAIAEQRECGELTVRALTRNDVVRLEQAKARRRESPVGGGVVA
jgi:hypothetical protein